MLGADLGKRLGDEFLRKKNRDMEKFMQVGYSINSSKAGSLSDFEIHQCYTSSVKSMADGLHEQPVFTCRPSGKKVRC